MATVYLARQDVLNRNAALKQLRTEGLADPSFAARFLREAQLSSSLSHPNIVTVYEYIEHQSVPYIAMEYLSRGSLRSMMRRLTTAQVTARARVAHVGLEIATEDDDAVGCYAGGEVIPGADGCEGLDDRLDRSVGVVASAGWVPLILIAQCEMKLSPTRPVRRDTGM